MRLRLVKKTLNFEPYPADSCLLENRSSLAAEILTYNKEV